MLSEIWASINNLFNLELLTWTGINIVISYIAVLYFFIQTKKRKENK